MTWTTIPDGDIDPDSPITTSLVTALRDNVAAAFAGDSGAPTAVAAAIAADAILRAKIKTTTVSLAGSMSTGTYTEITLSPYSFFPMIHTTAGDGNLRGDVRGHITDGASADNSRFALYNGNGNAVTYDVDYRYIQAS